MDVISPPLVTEFQHEALPDAANHTRLLKILDDNFSETIKVRCSITTWPAHKMPLYHAISYTWGDTESNATILINNKKFRVRTNCEFVLKQAYWYDKSCYYWIDAICIDQEDLEEKSKQVMMMGNIYKSADHVLACVGAHADDSVLLYREVALMGAIRDIRVVHERSHDFFKPLLTIFQRHGILTIRRFLHAARHFAKRPYFSRLWVVQELHHANQAYFLCGPDSLPKTDVYRIFSNLDAFFFPRGWHSRSMLISFLWSLHAAVHPQTKLQYRKSTTEDAMSNLLFITCHSIYTKSLLLHLKDLQCMQMRDKFYGILSILHLSGVVTPLPDYTKSDFEVAVDFVQPICDFMKEKEQSWDPVVTCADIRSLMGLDDRSEGVSEAIEARSGVPEPVLVILRPPRNASSTQVRSIAKGWRVSNELFVEYNSQFSVWKLPGSARSRAMLPQWVREGDWILKPKTAAWFDHDEWLLVLRGVAAGMVSPIVGQGVLTSGHSSGPADSVFQVYWNAEDLLLRAIMGRDFKRSSFNIGICNKQTPGSSYAIRQDIG